MARPIFVVHDQETIENYRRLERILRELYQVLGELLAYGAPVVPAASLPHTQPPPPPPPPPPETPAVLQNVANLLRTLLGQSFPSGGASSHSNNESQNSRSQNRRHRRRSSDFIEVVPKTSSHALGDWSALGSELRAVAQTLGSRDQVRYSQTNVSSQSQSSCVLKLNNVNSSSLDKKDKI